MPLMLDKILTLLAMPIGVAAIAGVFALAALAYGRRRVAFGLVAFSTVWLWGWSTPLVADRVAAPLVERFPALSAAELPAADAIVLLGGPDGDRVWRAARLYHAGKAPLVIVTGGPVWPDAGPSDASVMHVQLRALGVPEHATIIENESRNTRQNALFAVELAASLKIEHVLLVTSAYHMPRASAAFGRTLHVTHAAPRRLNRRLPRILLFLPSAPALSRSTKALREYLGLVVYRLRGWV